MLVEVHYRGFGGVLYAGGCGMVLGICSDGGGY